MLIICGQCRYESKTLKGMGFKVVDRLKSINLLAINLEGLSETEQEALVSESIVPQFICPECGALFFLSLNSDVRVELKRGNLND